VKPDVILLDLMLPVMDGLTVLRRLRDDPQWQSLPVIVFSNAYSATRFDEVWQAAATRVLAKASSTSKHVVEAIRAAVALRGPGDSKP
jgi:CheY-like chemotaxis protein